MKSFCCLISIFLTCLISLSQNVYQPRDLEILNSSAVYSICQDKMGAMWFNSSTGVFRYSGNELEMVHSPLIMRQFSPGVNKIYAPTTRSIVCFDIATVSYSSLPLPTTLRFDSSAFATKGDSLFFSVSKEIFLWDGNSVRSLCSLDTDISSLRFSDGKLFAGTSDGVLSVLDSDFSSAKACRAFPSSVSEISDIREGKMIVGLYSGGFSILDSSDYSILHSAGKDLRHVRSISCSENGDVYIGSVSGAFKFSITTGILTPVILGGESSLPVCSVKLDSDGNLWVGTYYNGIFYSDFSFPFSVFGIPSQIKAIKALVEDGNSRLWVVTDNYGIYFKPDGGKEWSCLDGSMGVKFQGADYDAATNSLWMGEYQGGLLQLDLNTLKFRNYTMPSAESVVTVKRAGRDLYIAGNKGVYLFDPVQEKEVRRSLRDSSPMVSCIDFDKDSSLIVAGYGLKLFSSDSVKTVFSNGLCTDVEIGPDGVIWAAVIGKGLARYDGGEVEWIDTPSHFIARSGVSGLRFVDRDRILLCSRSGLSLLSLSDKSVVSYSSANGLWSIASSVKSTVVRRDGSILVSGFNGIVSMNGIASRAEHRVKSLGIDNIFVNGTSRRDLLASGSPLVLEPGENNFRICLSDYDYSHSGERLVRWRLEGYDQRWKTLSGEHSLDFMNMSHGKYTLEIESVCGNDSDILSIPMRLRPFWYQTLLARMIFLLLVISVLALVLYYGWSRAVLSEKLRLREQENEDRIRFFRDLSLELRAPLNLAVGQLEKFFRDYGSRTKGIEDLESVYMKSRRMQSLISGFVDQQSENSGVDVEGAHFINAATGVVERHLFSGEMNVGVLCGELSMGKTKLSQLMQRYCSMSPREFIEDVRMKHADEMLREGRYRVAEISDRLGFSSPRYFLQRYKHKFGHAPTRR